MIQNYNFKNKHKYKKKKEYNSNKTIWLYGFHSVKAALINKNRKKYRLFCTKNAFDKLGEITKNLKIQISIVNINEFNKYISENSVHQGLALEVEPLKRDDISVILSQIQKDAIIILDRIKDPQNVGSIIRSAEILGCKAIIGSTYHCAQETGSLVKAASGAFETMPYLSVTNISKTIDFLRQNNFLILGLDHSGKESISELLKKLKKQPIAFILGSEEKGMRYLTKQKCDHLVKINSYSTLNVLNVSNAAAISLFAYREFL